MGVGEGMASCHPVRVSLFTSRCIATTAGPQLGDSGMIVVLGASA